MKHTLLGTLAYAVRIRQDAGRPDLQEHGQEIIDSIERDYLPSSRYGAGTSCTVDDRSTPEALRFLVETEVRDSNGDSHGTAAFDVTVRPSFELSYDMTVEEIGADNHSIFEECDCAPSEDETEEDFEHWETCQLGNQEMYEEDIAQELSIAFEKVFTDEEYMALSDLRAHLARA